MTISNFIIVTPTFCMGKVVPMTSLVNSNNKRALGNDILQ